MENKSNQSSLSSNNQRIEPQPQYKSQEETNTKKETEKQYLYSYINSISDSVINSAVSGEKNGSTFDFDSEKSDAVNSLISKRNQIVTDFFDHFFTIGSNSKCYQPNIRVLDCITGSGKTRGLAKRMLEQRFYNPEDKAKMVYAASSINELLEVVLSMYRILKHRGMRSNNIKNKVLNKFAYCFNFSFRENHKQITDLLESETLTRGELAFLKSLVITVDESKKSQKYKSEGKIQYYGESIYRSKIILTTHESLFNHASWFKGSHVFIDEVPNLAFDFDVETDVSAIECKAMHVTAAKMAYKKHIQPTAIGLKIIEGSIDVSALNDSEGKQTHIVYHLNPNHCFKSLTVMTAFAKQSKMKDLEKFLGVDFEWVSPDFNAAFAAEYLSLIESVVIDRYSITNADTKETIKALINLREQEKTLLIATQSQSVSLKGHRGLTHIKTNQVGLNRYSEYSEVLISTQRNFDNTEVGFHKILNGVDNKRDEELASAFLLQSIFRSSLRRRLKTRVVFASHYSYDIVMSTLMCYIEKFNEKD